MTSSGHVRLVTGYSWAAMRFGAHGVTLAVTITGVEALQGVVHSGGSFANDFEQTHLLNFWFYITTLTLLGMNLALAIRKQQYSIDELKTAITERKQSEQTYQMLFKTVRQGIVYQNPVGKIISANPAAERILGLSLDQLQGISSTDPYWNTIHPDGSLFPGETPPTMLAIKTGKPIEGVVMGIINPHAERTVWIRINAMPIFKENTDQVDYAYAAFEDITEQRQWENALTESEQRFRNIANAAPLLIWMSDTDKLCTWFSEGWLIFTGRRLEQEQGNGWTTGVHPDDFQYCLDCYIKHFDQRLPFSMEYRLKHHSGEYRWIHDSGMPRFGSNGEFLGYIEIAKRIGETIRAGDTVARLGGDEFVILLLGLDKLEEYMSMLDRLLLTISKPMHINNTQFPIGASIGVSIFPNNAEDSDTLLRQADQAMYSAKHAGKNRYYLCKE